MLCGSMLERVLISCIEVVNVTKIEIQDVFYTYSGDMLCEGMVERVLLCYIEVVNVTNIEIQDFLYL